MKGSYTVDDSDVGQSLYLGHSDDVRMCARFQLRQVSNRLSLLAYAHELELTTRLSCFCCCRFSFTSFPLLLCTE